MGRAGTLEKVEGDGQLVWLGAVKQPALWKRTNRNPQSSSTAGALTRAVEEDVNERKRTGPYQPKSASSLIRAEPHPIMTKKPLAGHRSEEKRSEVGLQGGTRFCFLKFKIGSLYINQ